jgi:hypothetical protein
MVSPRFWKKYQGQVIKAIVLDHAYIIDELLEQLEKRYWARLKLDEAVLNTIGFSIEEINERLPKVYDAQAK